MSEKHGIKEENITYKGEGKVSDRGLNLLTAAKEACQACTTLRGQTGVPFETGVKAY